MGPIDAQFYVWMFFRRLPFIVATTVIGAIVGVVVALSLTPTYRAVAKILVESPRVSSDLARTFVPTNAIEQLQVIEQRLTTREGLLTMARAYDVYPDIDGLSETDVANDMRSRTYIQPLLFDAPRGSTGAILFAISFDASSPALAARVANGYASTILEENEKLRKERAADAVAFIRQDVERLAKALAAAEVGIVNFKNEHKDTLPDGMEFRRIQQASQQQRLLQIQREEESLRSRRLTLKQIYAGGTGSVGPALPEDQMIADLRRALAEQRAIFAETSPTIVELRRRIQELEAESQEKRSAIDQGTDQTAVPAELQFQFADIDNQLKLLATERASIERNLAELDSAIGATVENAAALGRLQREYENAQTQYNDAQARLAEASTSARIEQQAVGQKLTLIESAATPEKSFGPRRRIVAAAGAGGGFAVGLALILLFEIWRAAIYRPADIARVFEGEPLVTVPFIRDSGASTRHPLVARLMAAFAVLALCITGPAVDYVEAIASSISSSAGGDM